jgi:hypothetical protein
MEASGSRVEGLGFRIMAQTFHAQVFRVWGLGFRVMAQTFRAIKGVVSTHEEHRSGLQVAGCGLQVAQPLNPKP